MGWLKKLSGSSKKAKPPAPSYNQPPAQLAQTTQWNNTIHSYDQTASSLEGATLTPNNVQLPTPVSIQPSNEFIYTPLEHPRNFRILHLTRQMSETGSNSYTEMVLHGSLVEASLDAPPKYFALSYCWGDPTFSETIWLEGKRLPITKSCALALRRLMKGHFSNDIWVDGICINQTPAGVIERGGQVALMDEIYSKAERVHVHLGESDAAADAGFKAIKELAMAYAQAIVPSPFQAMGRKNYEALADDALAITPEFPYGKLYGIFRLPWFKRTWVVQEVALAQKVVFYCGDHLIHFPNMVAGSDFSRLPYSKLNAEADYWKTYLIRHRHMNELVLRRDKGEQLTKDEMSLGRTMWSYGFSLQATKAEDKVYGLYGICKRLGFELPVPDYTKSVDVVYTETAHAIIKQDQNLEMLEWVEGSSGASFGLPSWVPDFSGSMYNWSPSNPPHMTLNTRTDAAVSGSSKLSYVFQADGRALKVRGRRLDLISEIGLPWMTDGSTSLYGDAPTNTGHYIGSLLDCIGTWFDVVHAQKGPLEVNASMAALALLLLNEKASLEISLDTAIKCLDRLLYSSKSTDARHRHVLITQGDSPAQLLRIGEYLISSTMQGVIAAFRGSMWRTVFSTKRGYAGVGSYSCQPGDVVAVLHGTRTPCTVRPGAEGYEYVGSAYVHGIMKGEFWKSGADIDDEWFVLT